ncbi:MAG: hypothetical protein ACTSRW_00980 [Candidatus Helarchaeota archaeon]
MLIELLTFLIIISVPYYLSLFIAIPLMFRTVCTGMESPHRTRFFHALLTFTVINLCFLIWNILTMLLSTLLNYEIPPTMLTDVIVIMVSQVVGLIIFLSAFVVVLAYFGHYLMNLHMQQ